MLYSLFLFVSILKYIKYVYILDTTKIQVNVSIVLTFEPEIIKFEGSLKKYFIFLLNRKKARLLARDCLVSLAYICMECIHLQLI